MAGLNSLISNQGVQTTTLPAWFDAAQQNLVNQATQAYQAAPTMQNTVGQQAVNQLSGPTNAFTTATGTLQDIASGAASPWITDASGNVSPNTATPLGGLFAAQNQQLNQLLPNISAGAEAGNIGSGQFGSLRGMTAVDKAKADALANLQTAQMQAALQNQATGVNAASAAGNVAQQGLQNLMNVGGYQQAAPFTNVANLGKVLGTVQAPQTVTNQTQLSPLNQIAGLATLLAGSGGSTGLVDQLFGSGGLMESLKNYLPNWGSTNWAGGMTTGQTTDANGNIITDPTYGAAGQGTDYNPYAGTDTNVLP